VGEEGTADHVAGVAAGRVGEVGVDGQAAQAVGRAVDVDEADDRAGGDVERPGGGRGVGSGAGGGVCRGGIGDEEQGAGGEERGDGTDECASVDESYGGHATFPGLRRNGRRCSAQGAGQGWLD
jgi:hypothetical protein